MSEKIHDLLGVGIGPFNLGLACLAEPLDLDAVFLDSRDGFAWHHGLMLDDATIQVPFLADLVTLADPTSPYSFLAYLKEIGRLYPFYIRENFQPLRAEYDAYCRWAADRVGSLRWGREVIDVRRENDTPGSNNSNNDNDNDNKSHDHHDDDEAPVYRVTAMTREGTEVYRTRHLVLGIGTTPWTPLDPGPLDGGGTVALHASEYLHRREELLELGSVTVVGSGQSAAEIYHDLLASTGDGPRSDTGGPRVDWLTRSPRFFPMEYTKLTLEMTSPEYVDHFHALPADDRERMLREQRSLYKGIDADLINQIHDTLYRRSVHGLPNGLLAAATTLDGAELDTAGADITGFGAAGFGTSRQNARPAKHTDPVDPTSPENPASPAHAIRLDLRCNDTDRPWSHHTEGLVLATGYSPTRPGFLAGIAHEIDRESPSGDAGGRHPDRYRVDRDHTIDRAHSFIHVQNAEEHTHGLTTPDLGMGAMRNSIILRTICGREVYPIESSIAFQQFGTPATRP